MSVDKSKLLELNNLVSVHFRRKHKIILNPESKNGDEEDLNDDILYDKAEWKISNELQEYVEKIARNIQLSAEEKILAIFEEISKEYVYDDNLISYIQKLDDEAYDLPDWYGREVDENWEKNRSTHRRRVCYELSRYFAKALTELTKYNEDYNVCILWDKGHTHYFVALTCSDYSVTLDMDDFNNIKDLTRLKAGLTAQGIVILDDKKGKFKDALDRFNNDRSNDAIKKIESDVQSEKDNASSDGENQLNLQTEGNEDVTFIRNALEILTQKYGIDSQGLYEYMKEIVDIKLGPEARKKIWKKLKGKDDRETRYIRCLALNIDNQKYLLDVDKAILRDFDEEELHREDPEFIPYKELTRDWGEIYDGS